MSARRFVLGPEAVIQPWEARKQDARYVAAVIEAHPALGVLAPDVFGPPKFDAYPTRMRHKVEVIVRQAARKHAVTPVAILGDGRQVAVVRARQEAFYRCRRELGLTYVLIGSHFNRDHATAVHGARKHAELNGLPLPDEDRP